MVIESKLAIRVSKKTSNSQDIVYYMYTTFFVQDYAFEPRFVDIAMCYTDCGNNVKFSHSRACMTCYCTAPLLLVFDFCPPSIVATDWGRQVSKSTCSCFSPCSHSKRIENKLLIGGRHIVYANSSYRMGKTDLN